MQTVSTTYTVADFCDMMTRRDITVNRDYQRSDKVWPESAKSYLIETMILGYPLPKIYLYQITDVKSRKTVKEIVDGQQRSLAIQDFFNNNFSLSKGLETDTLKGLSYSELAEEDKQAFLSFAISCDLLLGASEGQVVEVFRRMNSYTVPLNPEEHRHASYQGRFKWFANRVTKRYNGTFRTIGLFGEKQLVRMADTKLLAEVCDAILNGIRTTNKSILDRLYRDHDKTFNEEHLLENAIGEAVDLISAWEPIHKSNLMKPYIIYSLIVAISYLRKHFQSLDGAQLPKGSLKTTKQITTNLLKLSDTLNYDVEEAPSEYKQFVAACATRTNVRDQRITRTSWLAKALITNEL
jgi:hypothetical protein